jgi:hypothetical protein
MPRFVINEYGKLPQIIDIPFHVIEDMILNSRFTMHPTQLILSKRQAIVEAMLHFDTDGGQPISGFPRSLHNVENKLLSKLDMLSIEVISLTNLHRTSPSTGISQCDSA